MRKILFEPLSNGLTILLVLALTLAGVLGGGLLPGGEAVTLGATNFDVLQAGDGSVSEPAFGFTDDTNNGLYRIGADNVGLAAGGTLVSDWNATSLDMNALPVVNIGNAGTDFSSSGGLTLANALTVTGAISATSGISITGSSNFNSALNLNNNVLSNVGNAGTDFTASGGLQTANAITVTTGGISVTGGIAMASDTFSGTVHFGTVSNVISGTVITHGYTTTPTVILLTPVITSSVTTSQTVYITAMTATTATIGALFNTITAFSTVYWIAGK